MRIDSANTNVYTDNVNSNKVGSSQEKQPQTVLLQKAESREKIPNSSYFDSLNNLSANFLALKLQQQTTPKQAGTTTNQASNQTVSQATTVTKVATNEKIDPSLLDSNWTDKKGMPFANQNDYNKLVLESVKDPKNPWPDFSPKILKSIIAKESGFNAKANDGNGFIGLTQMNESTAKGEGKLSFANGDPRTQADKIIPATLRVLTAKSKALDIGATIPGKDGKLIKLPGFNYYGKPNEQDKIKFALAAYNVGQGKVLQALKSAYGDTIPKEVKYEDVEKFLRPLTQNYVKEIFERVEKQ